MQNDKNSDQFLNEVFDNLSSKSLKPDICDLFFLIESGSIASKDAGYSLIGLDIHFVVDLRLFFLCVGSDLLSIFGICRQRMKVGINNELGLNSEVWKKRNLSDSVSLQVDFKPDVLNKVRILNSKSWIFSMIDQSRSIKWQLGVKPLLIVFPRIIEKLAISIGVKHHFIEPTLLTNIPIVRKPETIKLTHPIFSQFTCLFHHHCADVFLFLLQSWLLIDADFWLFRFLWIGFMTRFLLLLDSCLDLFNLLLNLTDFMRSRCDFLLYHFVYLIQFAQLLFDNVILFAVCCCLQPFCVNFLFALQFGQRSRRSFPLFNVFARLNLW